VISMRSASMHSTSIRSASMRSISTREGFDWTRYFFVVIFVIGWISHFAGDAQKGKLWSSQS
jgi:hypothetical protein